MQFIKCDWCGKKIELPVGKTPLEMGFQTIFVDENNEEVILPHIGYLRRLHRCNWCNGDWQTFDFWGNSWYNKFRKK